MTDNGNSEIVERNKELARDAEAAMTAFVQLKEPRARDLESIIGQSLQEYLVDVLADLRHWALQNGLDYGQADRLGAGHFSEEINEEAEAAIESGGAA